MTNKKLSVLYVHHYGKFGGASKSLFELVSCFKELIVGHLVSQDGLVPRKFEEIGFHIVTTKGISIFDHTIFGYYHGLRWLVLLREFFYLPFTFVAILKAARLWKIDIIHINDVSLLPAIFLCNILFPRKPVVVHARIVLRKTGFRYRLYTSFLKRFCTHLIAIDKSVYNSLPECVPSSIIHNGLKMPIFVKPHFNSDKPLIVAMIGGLIQMKGLIEFVESAKILKERGVEVKFLIVGESPTNFESYFGKLAKRVGLVKDIREDIERFIIDNNLSDVIEIRPFTLNVSSLYEELDVLCFANYANAAGRPVFEAAFFGKPSICSEPADIADGLIHKQTGLCIDSRSPSQLSDAIEYFCKNRNEVVRMGQNAYRHACDNFDIDKNAIKVLDLYSNVYRASQSVNF